MKEIGGQPRCITPYDQKNARTSFSLSQRPVYDPGNFYFGHAFRHDGISQARGNESCQSQLLGRFLNNLRYRAYLAEEADNIVKTP